MRIRTLALLCVVALALGFTPASAAPGNDNLSDAAVITVPSTSTTDTTGATTEDGEPLPCEMAGATVWYQFQASSSGSLVADTFESDFDTVLAIYHATASSPGFGDLDPVDCNDQAFGNQSAVSFSAVAGETYYAQIGGWAPSGGLLPPILGNPQAAQGSLVFHLSEASSISGTVTNPDDDPIVGACVDALDPNDEFSFITGTSTDSNGNYSLSLAPGSYKIHFTDCNTYMYGDEWYNNQPDFYSADIIDLNSGDNLANIDAVLGDTPPPPPGPKPDIAVSGLTVTNVPITTDYGDVGYTGWVRRVSVTVSNVGEDAANDSYVDVYVCGDTPALYNCSGIGGGWVPALAPGESKTFTFRWNGLGSIGDMTVEAYAYTDYDTNYENNYQSVDHYVIVGGIGFGVSGPGLL